jgi:hypothetical protein
MRELKKIYNKVFVLLRDITLLIIAIIKHIILPNRKRKGNILNSILVFFIELIAILNRFEYGIFQMTKLFKHRYIRQGVIIISAFLFLLSSFEWSRGQEINVGNSNTNTVQVQPKIFRSISFNKATKAPNWLKKSSSALNHSVKIYRLPGSFLDSTPVKRYLFIRSILI